MKHVISFIQPCFLKRLCLISISVLMLSVTALADDYVIGDGDSLFIAVWGEPELNASVIVRPDGKITLAAIGEMRASGFTPMELTDKIKTELKKIIKSHPIVTVTVTTITNNKVYVFGDGAPPGVYNLSGRTTLLRFLVKLGALNNADIQRAYVMRNKRKLRVSFYDLIVRGDLANDIMLKAEDIIYIPDNEPKKIYVMGEVNNPKYVIYRKGLRILDTIMEAGGFTQYADRDDILVLRKTLKKLKNIIVKMDNLMEDGDLTQNMVMAPGDYIIVQKSIF